MKRLLGFIKKYLPSIIISVILSAFSVLFMLYVPIILGRAFDTVICKGNVDKAAVLEQVVKAFISACLSGILQYVCGKINNKISFSLARDVRQQAVEKLQRLPLSFMDTHPVGETVSRIINDTEALSDGLLLGFTHLFTGVFSVIATLVFMIALDIRIAIAVAVLTPASLLTASFIAKRTYRYSQKQSVTKGEQTAFIDEKISCLKTVKALGNENDAFDSFCEINNRTEKAGLAAVFFSSLVNPSTRFINSVIYAAVALFGGMTAYAGALTVGELVCFLSYVNQYTKPFNEISGVIAEMQNAVACADRVFDLIDMDEISETGNGELTEVTGDVRIKGVDFSYTKEKPLLENICVEAKNGSCIAIVGKTGCGKTTLINLLMRFYDADRGDILIDGKSIYSYTRKSLRRCFGMVLQETWLKNGTIRENISFGKPDASIEEIIDAAKQANAHSFIKKLEKGYDTVIGDEGVGLSEGQRQLLCIARVMLAQPEILILDEATSSIDTLTEQKVQEAFLKLLNGRTSFIVAHRLSTIKNADIILVMDNGKIAEQGSYEALMEKKGLFYQIAESRYS